jgi:hypothetical protein
MTTPEMSTLPSSSCTLLMLAKREDRLRRQAARISSVRHFRPARTMSIVRPRAALLLPALAAVLLVAPVGSALAQSRDVKLSGMGIRKCSDWQQWKAAGNAESRAMALEWAQGFIAGHNVYARTGTASPVVVSVSVLNQLLDSYCQKNPEERILSGVAEIIQSLGGAKINVAPKAKPAPNPRPDSKGRLDS